MSQKMFDDLIAEAPLHHPQTADRVAGLISTIADRIMDTQGDMVKISDLATTLRFDPDAMAQAILTAPAEAVDPAATAEAVDPAATADPNVKA